MLRSEIDDATPARVGTCAAALHVYDDGDWIVGVFEYVDGRPPGTRGTARGAGVCADRLGTTRSPIVAWLPTARSSGDDFGGWRPGERLARPLDDWSARSTISWSSNRDGRRGERRSLCISTSAATTSSSSRGRVVLVDWTHRASALLARLARDDSVDALEGGGDPRTARRIAATRRVGRRVAALAGFFVERGTQAGPAGAARRSARSSVPRAR